VKVGDRYNLKGFGRVTIKSLSIRNVVVSDGDIDMTIPIDLLLGMGKKLK
jgi:hypothetical protein